MKGKFRCISQDGSIVMVKPKMDTAIPIQQIPKYLWKKYKYKMSYMNIKRWQKLGLLPKGKRIGKHVYLCGKVK